MLLAHKISSEGVTPNIFITLNKTQGRINENGRHLGFFMSELTGDFMASYKYDLWGGLVWVQLKGKKSEEKEDIKMGGNFKWSQKKQKAHEVSKDKSRKYRRKKQRTREKAI